MRVLASPPSRLTPDELCLDTFQSELDYIYWTLRRLGTRPFDVEDLMQEVFLVLRRAWPEYDASRPPRPFLFAIAFRVSSAHQRKRRREREQSETPEPRDGGPDPEEALRTKQARELVLAALEGIPAPRRAVLVMHDIDDVPIRDVAELLKIPRFTAYSRLAKARRDLQTIVRRRVGPSAALDNPRGRR